MMSTMARGKTAARGTAAAGPARAPRAPRLATRRAPVHPGYFLDTRFLKPLGISRRRVNELINGRRAISADTALRLAAYFHNDLAFWMHLQVAWDLHGAAQRARGRLLI